MGRQSFCRFSMYGLGGGQNTNSFLCLLSLNIIHDKIFLAMWFLLSFVTLLSALSLVWRIVLVQSQTLRRMKLQWTYLQKREEGGPRNHDLVNPISVTHSNYLFFELFGQNFTKSLIRKTL